MMLNCPHNHTIREFRYLTQEEIRNYPVQMREQIYSMMPKVIERICVDCRRKWRVDEM